VLAVGNDGQFGRFCAIAGRPELAVDPRFVSASARTINREALIPILRELIARSPAAFWIAELERAGVPCGSINGIDQVFDNPQVKARGLEMRLRRSNGVEVPQVRNPIVFGDTPTVAHRAPPLLGEHTDEVLAELGHDRQAIDALRASGAIGPARTGSGHAGGTSGA
jgi:crotonobetainyl-CoA:carnitine CoA-transferase CaiB-like acyl-CoA transferase